MTRKELIEMTGSEEQAAYALDILLKGIKAPFLRMAIQAELGEIDSEISGLEAEGLIVKTNGTLSVNWQAEDAVFGSEPGAFWSATEEQRQEAERIREHLQKADALLYRRNRTVSLLAAR